MKFKGAEIVWDDQELLKLREEYNHIRNTRPNEWHEAGAPIMPDLEELRRWCVKTTDLQLKLIDKLFEVLDAQ